MRKNVIAMSVATLVAGLGLAGGASAAVFVTAGSTADREVVNPGGVGHQLIVPYYSTQGGNTTLFNITNTDTVNGKAVKVRFRSAANSDDVFDFQLYMSAGDVWAANVSQNLAGIATLTTVDKSCTLPAGVGTTGNKDFVTARLPAAFTPAQQQSLTREGYIEIFNMADIKGGTIGPVITHSTAGVPTCSTTTMATLANDPVDAAAAAALGFLAPTTGLMANWIIINVAKSGASSGESISITATVPSISGVVPGGGNIVFFPQTSDPVGGTGVNTYTADPALRTAGVTNGDGTAYAGTLPIVSASNFDLPDMSTPYITAGIGLASDPVLQAEALSRALATTAVMNEYLGDKSISANTDWVFSMPTRRYSVAMDYRPMTSGGAPKPVFTEFVNRQYFMKANTSVNSIAQICVRTGGVTYFNREEGTAQGVGFVISPNPPVAAFALCGETSVLSFNSNPSVPGISPVLYSTVAYTNFVTDPGFVDGWAYVTTPGLATGAQASATGNGLPIVGKAFLRAQPGVGVGFFGASWEHRYLRPVTP